MTLHADLRQVIYALSDALDLVGVDDVAHGKRVGIMAAECARAMGCSPQTVIDIFDLGLLHDIGVSSTATHQHLVSEFDWAGSQEHAKVGYVLLKDFKPLARMALPVRYHHTRWDALSGLDLNPEVCWQANLILLVDRVDALAAPYYATGQVLQHSAAIRAEIERRRGTYFKPELVDTFMQVSASEAFWLLLEPRAVANYLQDIQASNHAYEVSATELHELARIFSCIVDAKSPFTARHSQGVARVARRLGERLGVPAERCDQLEIAALLHDIGKLRVPDEILEKPGPLDDNERLIIHAHSFETLQILRNIRGFEDIAPWAAFHHEEPGGRGYPFHLDGAQLPLEARILRVADIFQAMVQDRPYRQGWTADAVIAFLHQLQQDGRLEPMLFDAVKDDVDTLMVLARDGVCLALPPAITP